MFSMNKSSLIPMDTPILFILTFVLTTIILLVVFIKKFQGKRKKIFKFWCLGWLALAITLFISGSFGKFVDINTVNTKTYTKKQLTEDLKQLEKNIMEENPLYFTDKNELKNYFSKAYGEIEDGMTELEFYRLINPIVVAVRCGHTYLSSSEALIRNREDRAKFFPLKVTLVDNELYMLENNIENDIYAGDRILSINGKTTDEIINILLKNISGDDDNKQKPRYIISKHFNSRYYSYVDTSKRFRVELTNGDDSVKIVDLMGKFRQEFNTSSKSILFSEYKDGNYYEGSIYEDYAVLDINVFFQEKDNKFDAFLKKFFSDLEQKNISKLIIDVRGNFGGTPMSSKSLLSYLVKEEIEYFEGNLELLPTLFGYKKPVSPAGPIFDGDIVILTDGACFSTTGHFCALVKYHNLGTLIGSETAGTFVCTNSSKRTLLNHTRFRLRYSTSIYKVAVEGMSSHQGVKPHISVSPTIEDILNNRDVQMDAALQFLKLK